MEYWPIVLFLTMVSLVVGLVLLIIGNVIRETLGLSPDSKYAHAIEVLPILFVLLVIV